MSPSAGYGLTNPRLTFGPRLLYRYLELSRLSFECARAGLRGLGHRQGPMVMATHAQTTYGAWSWFAVYDGAHTHR